MPFENGKTTVGFLAARAVKAEAAEEATTKACARSGALDRTPLSGGNYEEVSSYLYRYAICT
jgi:hypothetical protein